jgi:hypothetical protein
VALNQFVTSNIGWLWLVTLLIAAGALAWIGWLQIRLGKVNAEYKALVAGTSGGNLEQIWHRYAA